MRVQKRFTELPQEKQNWSRGPLLVCLQSSGLRVQVSVAGDLTRHMDTFSLDAQTKRLKQESRVYVKLREWRYVVDRETVMNASRGGCVSGTLRQLSRLDFHIVSCTNAVLIVECEAAAVR